MKRIVHLTAVVVFACLLIAFYATNVTTYASEKSDNECELCGKPSDSHGKPVIIEKDGSVYVLFKKKGNSDVKTRAKTCDS